MTEYIKIFEDYLKKELKYTKPENLYNPVKYLLESGGKRLRPIIALNVSELLGGKISDTLPAAAALEIFHNFTLAHDDIMDNSMLRRGKKTINSKWDNNTGILSGDVMLIISYEVLNQYQDSKYIHLSKKLTEISRLVCEGQQADMDFASKNDITENEYFEMIKNKTAVLIGCSFMFGGIVAEANDLNTNLLYEIGLNLGIAFQLEDDLLDCFGDQEKFGKKIGGDIIEKKKTLLYLFTNLKLESEKKLEFENIFNSNEIAESEKINSIKLFYETSGALKYVKNKVKVYFDKADQLINKLELDNDTKRKLNQFSKTLLNREI
jgi:geranylgeranyl diphosphate synthase type II|tara:strand:- start:2821 stop:3786 length:966 start_codon:yes stop_codon:yes gene_type:complete